MVRLESAGTKRRAGPTRDAQSDLGHPQRQQQAEENGDQTENEFPGAGHVIRQARAGAGMIAAAHAIEPGYDRPRFPVRADP